MNGKNFYLSEEYMQKNTAANAAALGILHLPTNPVTIFRVYKRQFLSGFWAADRAATPALAAVPRAWLRGLGQLATVACPVAAAGKRMEARRLNSYIQTHKHAARFCSRSVSEPRQPSPAQLLGRWRLRLLRHRPLCDLRGFALFALSVARRRGGRG